MEKTKQILKNDQNNHLATQVEQFVKIAPIAKKDSKSVFKESTYETLNLDTVTTTYIRGYN